MIQGISYVDHLIRKAHGHWGNYEQLPLDLFADMNNAGIDVTEVERQFYETFEGETTVG